MSQATTTPTINSVVQNIDKYSSEDLRTIFLSINPYLLKRWMDHFIREEKYEVCQVIKNVMSEQNL